MKRRLICTFLSCMMVLILFPVIVGAADTGSGALTIELESTEAANTANSTVKIDVNLTSNPGFVSATIPVVWDSDVLELTAVENSEDTIPGWLGAEDLSAYDGKYYLAWNNDTDEADYTDTGRLCTLVFTVKQDMDVNATTEISVDTEEFLHSVMNFDMQDLTQGEVDGVEVGYKASTVTMVEKVLIPGDVDGSEELTSDDALYLINHIIFEQIMPGMYPVDESIDLDYNSDGAVSSEDALYLLNHIIFEQIMPGMYPLYPSN